MVATITTYYDYHCAIGLTWNITRDLKFECMFGSGSSLSTHTLYSWNSENDSILNFHNVQYTVPQFSSKPPSPQDSGWTSKLPQHCGSKRLAFFRASAPIACKNTSEWMSIRWFSVVPLRPSNFFRSLQKWYETRYLHVKYAKNQIGFEMFFGTDTSPTKKQTETPPIPQPETTCHPCGPPWQKPGWKDRVTPVTSRGHREITLGWGQQPKRWSPNSVVQTLSRTTQRKLTTLIRLNLTKVKVAVNGNKLNKSLIFQISSSSANILSVCLSSSNLGPLNPLTCGNWVPPNSDNFRVTSLARTFQVFGHSGAGST